MKPIESVLGVALCGLPLLLVLVDSVSYRDFSAAQQRLIQCVRM